VKIIKPFHLDMQIEIILHTTFVIVKDFFHERKVKTRKKYENKRKNLASSGAPLS